jgi:2'-5' RNA ligase
MKTRKLFFALPLSEIDRKLIADWAVPAQKKHNANWVPAQNYHVTLAYLGPTPDDSLDAIIEFADEKLETGLLPFSWTVNHVSYFRSGVFYLTGYNTPMVMTRLARDLEFLIPLHHKPLNFIPHVTLARNAHEVEMTPNEHSLTFDQVALFESVSTPEGVEYKSMKTWW